MSDIAATSFDTPVWIDGIVGTSRVSGGQYPQMCCWIFGKLGYTHNRFTAGL